MFPWHCLETVTDNIICGDFTFMVTINLPKCFIFDHVTCIQMTIVTVLFPDGGTAFMLHGHM